LLEAQTTVCFFNSVTIEQAGVLSGLFCFENEKESVMTETFTKGESHGCIMCGKLYQLYVVTDSKGKFVDAKVMSAGGRLVKHPQRALVACETHSNAEIEAAVARAYGIQTEDDDD